MSKNFAFSFNLDGSALESGGHVELVLMNKLLNHCVGSLEISINEFASPRKIQPIVSPSYRPPLSRNGAVPSEPVRRPAVSYRGRCSTVAKRARYASPVQSSPQKLAMPQTHVLPRVNPSSVESVRPPPVSRSSPAPINKVSQEEQSRRLAILRKQMEDERRRRQAEQEQPIYQANVESDDDIQEVSPSTQKNLVVQKTANTAPANILIPPLQPTVSMPAFFDELDAESSPLEHFNIGVADVSSAAPVHSPRLSHSHREQPTPTPSNHVAQPNASNPQESVLVHLDPSSPPGGEAGCSVNNEVDSGISSIVTSQVMSVDALEVTAQHPPPPHTPTPVVIKRQPSESGSSIPAMDCRADAPGMSNPNLPVVLNCQTSPPNQSIQKVDSEGQHSLAQNIGPSSLLEPSSSNLPQQFLSVHQHHDNPIATAPALQQQSIPTGCVDNHTSVIAKQEPPDNSTQIADVPVTVPEPPSSTALPFLCASCGDMFPTEGALNLHVQSHAT